MRKGSKDADPEAFWTRFLLNKGIKLINITLTVSNHRTNMSTNYSLLLSLQTWLDLVVIYILQTRYDRSDCVASKIRVQKVP